MRVFSRGFSSARAVFLAHGAFKRRTLLDIQKAYTDKKPIAMVTSYDYITGKFAETADMDINLVGDSLAMTALGYEDTNEITLDEFMFHTRAVTRGNKRSFMVADLPFGYHEKSPEQAIETAILLVKQARIQGVKIEGGRESISTVRRLVEVGIPVMGHVGLTPQRHNALGGFKLQGTSPERAVEIYEDCLALQDAGVFLVVLECIPNKLAEYITSKLSVPTIGIGAGPGCSGQVLVMADLLGMGHPEETHRPKFVKQYADIFTAATRALEQYKSDLNKGVFPNPDEHGYKMKRDAYAALKEEADKILA